MIYRIEDKDKKRKIAREILNKLPEWFGLPDSVDEYVKCSKDMPFWADIEEECTRGFIALKETRKLYYFPCLLEYGSYVLYNTRGELFINVRIFIHV